MPTLSPYIAAPEDDEEEGFSAGLTRDLRYGDDDRSNLGPTSANAPPPPPAAPVATAPAVGAAPQPTAPPSDASVAPVYTPPDRSGLQQWQTTLSRDQQPINRQDPSVKPRWWERVLGGVGAGLMAANGNTEAAVRAGSAVVNRRYNQAEEARQGRVRADEAAITGEQGRIAGSDQDFQRRLQSFSAQGLADQRNATAEQRRSQEQQRLQSIAPGTEQPDDPQNPLGSWHATTIEGKTVPMSQPPDSYLKTPAGQLAVLEQKAAKAGVKPGSDDWKYLMANGKLKEPAATTNIHIPSAEAQQYNDWKAAFQRQNGRAPNATEVAAYKPGGGPAQKPVRGTPEQFAALDKDTAAGYKKAQAEYADANSIATTPAQREAAAKALDAELTRIGLEHSQRLRDLGGIPAEDSGQPGAALPAAAPAAQAPPPPAAPPAAATPPPAAPQQQGATPPPAALAGLKPGFARTLINPVTKQPEKWTIQNGQPVKVQ